MNTRKHLVVLHYIFEVIAAISVIAAIISLIAVFETENPIPLICAIGAFIVSYGIMLTINVVLDFYDAIVVPKQQLTQIEPTIDNDEE